MLLMQCGKEAQDEDIPKKDPKSICLEDQMMLWEDEKCIKKYKRGYLEPGEGFYLPFTKDLPFDEKRLYESLVRIKIEIDPNNDALSQKQKDSPERYGTGFFVSSDGYLFTAYHVIRHCLDSKARSSEHINVAADFFKCKISFQTYSAKNGAVKKATVVRNFKVIYLPSYKDAFKGSFNEATKEMDINEVNDVALLKLDSKSSFLEISDTNVNHLSESTRLYSAGFPGVIIRESKHYPDSIFSDVPKVTIGKFIEKTGNGLIISNNDRTGGLSGGPLIGKESKIYGLFFAGERNKKEPCKYKQCIASNSASKNIHEVVRFLNQAGIKFNNN